jgi:hypothetical protein
VLTTKHAYSFPIAVFTAGPLLVANLPCAPASSFLCCLLLLWAFLHSLLQLQYHALQAVTASLQLVCCGMSASRRQCNAGLRSAAGLMPLAAVVQCYSFTFTYEFVTWCNPTGQGVALWLAMLVSSLQGF